MSDHRGDVCTECMCIFVIFHDYDGCPLYASWWHNVTCKHCAEHESAFVINMIQNVGTVQLIGCDGV